MTVGRLHEQDRVQQRKQKSDLGEHVYKFGLARPGILEMVGSMFVSYLAEFFSLRQKPHALVGSSILAFLRAEAICDDDQHEFPHDERQAA